MKFIAILVIGFMFSACSSKPAHHEHAGHDHAHGAHAHGDHPHGDHAAHAAAAPAEDCCGKEKVTTASGDTNLTAAMLSPELMKAFNDNKTKIGKECSAAASAYCGKVSRDMSINETELSCLWEKVNRKTRESLPKLDNTACAKSIKTFAAKPKAKTAAN